MSKFNWLAAAAVTLGLAAGACSEPEQEAFESNAAEAAGAAGDAAVVAADASADAVAGAAAKAADAVDAKADDVVRESEAERTAATAQPAH